MSDEESILSEVFKALPPSSAVVPTGDDACVLAPRGNVVASTDILVENVHFRRDWSSGADVGWRVVAQNVADAVAMGARPRSILIAVTVPPEIGADWLNDFTRGAADACTTLSRTPIGIDGGDIARGQIVVACGTIMGDLDGREPVLRSGARPGHILAHCGHLGRSAHGYSILESGGDGGDADLFRRPVPPTEVALAARPAAMMDVSDGLLRDAKRMAGASSVRFLLDRDAIDSLRSPGVTMEMALSGGEDHGFLAAVEAVPPGWTRIGRVEEGAGVFLDDTEISELGGWDHFA